MVEVIFPNLNVLSVKYFTALVSNRPNDLNQSQRQQVFFRALKTIPNLEIIMGHYLSHAVNMPYEVPTNGNRYARVIKTEEKGSDVNLATHMLMDAFEDKYDVVVLISNDSDLALPLKIIREKFKKQIYIVNPHKKPSAQLQNNSDRLRELRQGHLIASQFPNPIHDSKGEIIKPASWS